jgi:protein-L-isoaspartate(D-aspartate) O-methyltransferase
MTGKPKNFPLSLASLDDKSRRQAGSAPPAATRPAVATPQTATRNAAVNGAARSAPLSASPSKSHNNLAARSAYGTPPAAAPARPAMPGPMPAAADGGRHPQVSQAVRRAMVNRVAAQGVQDKVVLAAMEAVQRHLFMEPALSGQAYIDASLPIGHHQTISQPYIVARMIEVMRNGTDLRRVLEIGTGCGYQAAVLSCVAQEVYSIERIKPLHELAKSNLRPMRIPNLRLHYGDGMLGLAQAAPFDGIILACAGMEVPQALLDQLAIGGRLVAPVGGRHQVLQLFERSGKAEWTSTTLENCHFVPLRPGIV